MRHHQDTEDEVPAEDDNVWEGPWIESMHRALTASEARIFSRRAGLAPAEAAAWMDAGFGPYAAERSRARGHDLAAAIEHEAAKAAATWPGHTYASTMAWCKAGVESPDDASRLISLGFDPGSAGDWSRAGFSVTEAVEWAETGLAPDEARQRREAGDTRDVVISILDPSKVLVWGLDHERDRIHLARLCECNEVARWQRFTSLVREVSSWAELVERADPEWAGEIEELIHEEWLDSDPECPAPDASPDGGPPSGWLPPGSPGHLDWEWSRPRIDDPYFVELPMGIRRLAGVDLTGNGEHRIWWHSSDLGRIISHTRSAGCAITRNDASILGLIEAERQR